MMAVLRGGLGGSSPTAMALVNRSVHAQAFFLFSFSLLISSTLFIVLLFVVFGGGSQVRPILSVKVPGGAAAWQIIVSRNGKYILINSADCSLRLFDVGELSMAFLDDNYGKSNDKCHPCYPKVADIKPRFVFQDNISKVITLDLLSKSQSYLGYISTN